MFRPKLPHLALLSTLALGVASPAAAQAPAQPVPAPAPAAPAPPAQTPAATALADKVQAFYDKTTSFSSDFVQEYLVKSHNLKKTSKGSVLFAKPGKMAWDYAEPAGNKVVSDGATLKVYEAANKQLFEQSVQKSQYPAALSFLTGTGKLKDSFAFEVVAGDKMGFKGGSVLVGSPKDPTPAFTKVFFYVDDATSQVRRVLILDAQGNRNRFDFVAPRINEPVDAKRFAFVPPPGTTIVRP